MPPGIWPLLLGSTAARCWNASAKQPLPTAPGRCDIRLPACDADESGAAWDNKHERDTSAKKQRDVDGCEPSRVDHLVYVHNQKAGGTTFKDALIRLCHRCDWVCWLPEVTWIPLRRWTEALVPHEVRSASYVEQWLALPQHARNATRVLLADRGRAMLACQRVDGRCVYATNVREPVSQMISHYNCKLAQIECACVSGARLRLHQACPSDCLSAWALC